jgi:hypothetical protein
MVKRRCELRRNSTDPSGTGQRLRPHRREMRKHNNAAYPQKESQSQEKVYACVRAITTRQGGGGGGPEHTGLPIIATAPRGGYLVEKKRPRNPWPVRSAVDREIMHCEPPQ